MQINKINNADKNPNFRANITIQPAVLERLIGKNYAKTRGVYLNLIDFQYSPLDQRKILYNILKHIKKDNLYKICELGGGSIWNREHVYMKLDGVIGGRSSFFGYCSEDSNRSSYIQHILCFAEKTYPNIDFTKSSKLSDFSDKVKKFFSRKERKMDEYDYYANKIKKLIVKDPSV